VEVEVMNEILTREQVEASIAAIAAIDGEGKENV
jgi:hypothetical protein